MKPAGSKGCVMNNASLVPCSQQSDQQPADAYKVRILAAIQRNAERATVPRLERNRWGRKWGRP